MNPVENIWRFLRQNWLSNRVFRSYDDIVDHCCYAWKQLTDQPPTIMSIGLRDWAQVGLPSDFVRQGTVCHRRSTPNGLPPTCAAHWTIENQLHWVMDVVFHDDLCRLRTGHAPHNMATVRHVALNLIKGANDKASIKVRRRKAAWSVDYLETIIRQAA